MGVVIGLLSEMAVDIQIFLFFVYPLDSFCRF